MNTREAILTGGREAARLHATLRSQEELNSTRGPVDVFGALLNNNVAVIFRPLKGLLGAYLTKPARGVIISTQRPLPVQRFTGAHELGHIAMHHSISLDGEEILLSPDDLTAQEMQANAFASEFLMPRWLLALHGKAQEWDRKSLENPGIVYQLALRMGASYEATLVTLHRHQAIDQGTLAKLRSVQLKTIKQQLLPGYEPTNWFRDVWLLTKKDEGTVIEGQPDDIFIFRLSEKSSAGYLWDIEELKKQGFAIVRDTRDLQNCADGIGGPVERLITAQSEHAAAGELVLPLRRPWEEAGPPGEQLHLSYDLRGKETGLPRALRRHPASARW